MSKIRVLSVDDSALMRQIMTEIINSHSDMEMVATAPDPLVARDLIKKFNPDVLTLDVEMPRMDGLDFLEKINAFASNARSDGFFPDRQRVRSHAARAGAGGDRFLSPNRSWVFAKECWRIAK